MVKIVTKAREKFVSRRDKHGLKMGLALQRLGSIFKVKKYK